MSRPSPAGSPELLVFLRHGAFEVGPSDPPLSTGGWEMAARAAAWVAALDWAPTKLWHTPTQRTTETAMAIVRRMPHLQCGVLPDSPANVEEWADLLRKLRGPRRFGDPTLPRAPMPPTILVGHHPTLGLLLDLWGPSPIPVDRFAFAAGLFLVADGGRWQIVDVHPGG